MKYLYIGIALLIPNIGFSQSVKSEIASLRQDYGYMLSRMEQAEKNIIELKNNIAKYQQKIDSLLQINYALIIQAKNTEDKRNQKISTSPSTENNIETNVKTDKQQNNYGRCKATTQKGSQCSRSAGSSGFCWQHD